MATFDKQRTGERAHRIIVMTRFPESGQTKTRLIPTLGPDCASALHGCLITRTLSVVLQSAEVNDSKVDVRYTGGNEEQFRSRFGFSGDQLRSADFLNELLRAGFFQVSQFTRRQRRPGWQTFVGIGVIQRSDRLNAAR